MNGAANSPVFQLTEVGISALDERIKAAVEDPRTGIPGAMVAVVNRNGKSIFSTAAGQVGANSAHDMTSDAVFWIASCSKMILAIACMQLVEQGLLRLDDADQVEKICPRLAEKQVLTLGEDNKPCYVPQKSRITLRMLLNHTAGFGYSGCHPLLRDWIMARSKNPLDFDQPLIAQPGEEWHYGVSPLSSGGIFPSDIMKGRLVKMNRQLANGTHVEGNHFMRSILDCDGEAEKAKMFQNAAGGCFAEVKDFCDIVATLLNDGVSPITGNRILQASTVQMMFENQVPAFPKRTNLIGG